MSSWVRYLQAMLPTMGPVRTTHLSGKLNFCTLHLAVGKLKFCTTHTVVREVKLLQLTYVREVKLL